jgi:hypothetical protein
MKKFDWKGLGQFLSMILNLFGIIRETCLKLGVGVEIVGWLLDEKEGGGRQTFIEDFLMPLGLKYLKAERIRVLSPTAILVNLDAAPRLPFSGAKVEKRLGTGWVKIERLGDDLYMDTRKVELFRTEKQETDLVNGHEIRSALSGMLVLNANILDALCEYQDLIPDSWKKQIADGNFRSIFFWGTEYRGTGEGAAAFALYVRYLGWNGRVFYSAYNWTSVGFDAMHVAAAVAAST